MNPADFVIAIANSLYPTKTGKFLTSIELADYYITTNHYKSTMDMIKECIITIMPIRGVDHTNAIHDNNVNDSNKQTNQHHHLTTTNTATTGNHIMNNCNFLFKNMNREQPINYHTSLFHQIKVLLYRRYLIMKRSQNVVITHLIR